MLFFNRIQNLPTGATFIFELWFILAQYVCEGSEQCVRLLYELSLKLSVFPFTLHALAKYQTTEENAEMAPLSLSLTDALANFRKTRTGNSMFDDPAPYSSAWQERQSGTASQLLTVFASSRCNFCVHCIHAISKWLLSLSAPKDTLATTGILGMRKRSVLYCQIRG